MPPLAVKVALYVTPTVPPARLNGGVIASCGVVGGVVVAQLVTDLPASSRPPVLVLPESEEIGFALLSMVFVRFATLRFPHAASTRAATPDTCGAAIDVPLM